MRKQLHILTRPADALAKKIIQCQQTSKKDRVEVADLTLPAPDYKHLLERIFEAESVQVW